MPAAPRPAIALPTIKATELGAVAHIKDPTSNRAMAPRYIVLMEKMLYSFP